MRKRHEYKQRHTNELSKAQQAFLSELKDLLGKHDVYLVACKDKGSSDPHVGFQFAAEGFQNIECNRLHVGAYDLSYLTWKRLEQTNDSE